MGPRRIWLGAAVGGAGLAACTLLLAPHRHAVSLAGITLLYLIPVVATAAVGGPWPALAAVAGADLLVNFFFIPPYHTFVVETRDHVIVLAVYILVAAAVAAAVEVAARQRARAARRDAEVALLAQATAEPVAEQSLTRLLTQVRDTFTMTAVALLESSPTGEHPVAAVGSPPPGRPVLSAPAGDGLRLAAWGPALIGEDRQTLARLAGAAARTLEAQRLADQAARARDLAEVDRVRAALLAAVGHDLRTPLACVKAAVSSLRQPDLHLPADARAELLATIEDSTDRLDALVENLLSMSRLQAGMLSVHLENVALDAVVARALLHQSDNGRVELDVPDALPLVHTDPGLLERILANLIANACTASPPQQPIHIDATATDRHVRLRVIDHGPGVPAADQERIFAPFQRLHDRGHGGLGLGLAIARGFTDAIGATLTPADTPGGGLTMTITLPRSVP
ncbi:two-component system, OmpR family, sensor histidine kinase KdpD [Micromonospora pattaloongensis]|uniref:histidine kinase n=1 Tax=Micromonospora pattaloongensis TaxID=405436 RepID=A0A1H3P7D2_9ACTN|nr:ATP-binding protein [Micromonospora pattaloongensis]SDY96279.1 two-component system, OmpR family, sensor histidine kinase KdpD [Micromonospora pattaloongensis]